MKKLVFLFFILTCITNSLQSQSIVYDLLSSRPDYSDTINSIDTSFSKCNSKWITNDEWSNCLLTHIDMWEVYVKKTYDTLMSLLDSNGQILLKRSQESWTKSNADEDKFSNYLIFTLGNNFFGREGDFKRFYSDLYEVRNRGLELKSCLKVIREIKKEDK
jgi:hypothetical protein